MEYQHNNMLHTAGRIDSFFIIIIFFFPRGE